jgi:hypothetical protein
VQNPCTQGGNQKITLQGANKKKLQGGKTKLAHITGGINLFTLEYIIYQHIYQSKKEIKYSKYTGGD